MPLCNSLPECYPLRTRSHRVRSILHVRAVNVLTVFGEYRGSNAELRVGAVRGSFGGRAAGVQSVELSCGYGIGFASLGDMSFVIGLENGSRHIGRRQRKGRGKRWG
jgi:hypothetical protein